ncbi:hypothetical protein RHPLAN_33010 [Rhodoplanes sp. Z2-YC6860]|nr:hypothetical protein RHPLAN_33010 [Rhodoplanes sp. Z2-YC6860]
MLAAAAGLALGLALSGCGSISEKFAETASQAPQIGLPGNAPARPTQMAYPAVHDVPPPRTATVLTDVEQQKLESDLLAARKQQQIAAGVPVYKPEDAKPAGKNAAKNTGKNAAKNTAKSSGDKNQPNQDQASAPAPISSASSRTIY